MSILDRVLTLIRDDSYAATFQSLGQYRAALLQAVRGEAAETGANGLLPCPFCGGTDSIVERLDNCSAYVMCSNMLDEHSCCTARGPNGIQEDDGEEIPGAAAAIAAWNQRAAPAVQGEPFMYGISGPDGRPHFDDHCVSSEAHTLFEEVDVLNGDDDAGYQVIALYAAFASHRKGGGQ